MGDFYPKYSTFIRGKGIKSSLGTDHTIREGDEILITEDIYTYWPRHYDPYSRNVKYYTQDEIPEDVNTEDLYINLTKGTKLMAYRPVGKNHISLVTLDSKDHKAPELTDWLNRHPRTFKIRYHDEG